MYSSEHFLEQCAQMKIELSEKQLEQFQTYYEMLVEWNSFMNLTAITEYQDVYEKHFLDSLSLVNTYDVTSHATVIDVGTGAGFPGLALKIAFPNLKVTLLDSLNKRIQFLNTVIEKLELTDIVTIHGRAEDFAKPDKLRESFDLCVSRAVANLSTLCEYDMPFVKVGGLFISYKSEKVKEELEAATHAISLLGGVVEKQVDFTLPGTDLYRNLLTIKKVSSTPKKFPRKAGTAAKQPLV